VQSTGVTNIPGFRSMVPMSLMSVTPWRWLSEC